MQNYRPGGRQHRKFVAAGKDDAQTMKAKVRLYTLKNEKTEEHS
jgi:hypothetical protein